MSPEEKRSVSVTVKMTTADFEQLKRSSLKLWPGAIMSNSSIVLSLAKLGSETVSKLKGRRSR